MNKVKKLYRQNKAGKYVYVGHVPDNYQLENNEKFEATCKYCGDGQNLINTLKCGEGMEVYIEKGKLLAAYSYFPAGYVGPVCKTIKFCPMCGISLDELR